MDIKNEIDYCLNCKNKPCAQNGCPLENDIPSFIKAKDEKEAFEILCKTTVLPSICGRICPKSRYCQGNCIRRIKSNPVQIGKIESYIGDIAIEKGFKIPKKSESKTMQLQSKTIETKTEKNKIEKSKNIEKNENNKNNENTPLTNKKVAIIGSGPAGLTCAAFLAMEGIQVTIYEKNKNLGGILNYGIPDFRLEKRIVNNNIKKILELGIETKTQTELGKDFNIKDIYEKYDAIFISIGASLPKKIFEEENVISGNTLLENFEKGKIEENSNEKQKEINKENINKNKINNFNEENLYTKFINKKVIVYGGGNVAIDVARTLKRLKAEPIIVYRRNIEQMPAEIIEIENAKKEKINIIENTGIISYKNKIANCIKTKLVEKETYINDETKTQYIKENVKSTSNEKTQETNIKKEITRIICKNKEDEEKNLKRKNTKIENIEGSNFEIKADYLILAIGSQANTELIKNQGIKTDEKGFAKIDNENHTSIKKIYAGGDLVGKEATVASAARSGRETAKSIIKDLLKV